MGLLTATVNYIRGGCVDLSAAVSGSIGAFLGSIVGTGLALSLSPRALQLCLMVILPLVGVFIISGKGTGNAILKPPPPFRLKMLICFLIGLVFGCYDGFFGPGAGMFMTITLSGLVHMDLIKSSGTARLINFSSNITSMITWMINGKILFPIAIPCVFCSVTGAYLGSRMAMKVGKKLIRIVLVIVALLLFVKILMDLISSV
jgi:uncharacterized membrane protein YfcA